MDSFTDKPLLALEGISARCQPITAEDLRRLKSQIGMVLAIHESEMRPLTLIEMARGVTKYGPGAVVIGGFVIKRR